MIKHLTRTLAAVVVFAVPMAAHATPAEVTTANDWEWIEKNQPASLVKNGDLETTTTKGVPRNWNTWTRHGGGKFESVTGVENKGVQISAPKPAKGVESSVLSQNIPVEVGKRYVAVVWVRVENKDDAEGAGISLRLRDDKGWWDGKPSVLRGNSPIASDEWQKLLVSATIPEGVTGVGLLLGASNGKAVYDNAALYVAP